MSKINKPMNKIKKEGIGSSKLDDRRRKVERRIFSLKVH
jgi:hypothetical protein